MPLFYDVRVDSSGKAFLFSLFGVICGTQNCLRMRGKYLNAFGEYAESIYASMEKKQRESWRILLIRQEI
jgi:hypothetical protein